MATQNNYARYDGLEPGECAGIDGNRLHHACLLHDTHEVKRILENKSFDPNIRDVRGMTPLATAAFYGAAPCIKELLADSRVNPDLLDRTGRTALIAAAESGHLNCVKALRKRSVLEHEEHGCNANALQTAALNRHTDIVKYLARYIDPRESNSLGQTALFYAAESGSLPCLRLLMTLSDVQAIDHDGCNALMQAAKNGRLNVVMELLPMFSLNTKNNAGKDALAIAKQSQKEGLNEDAQGLDDTIKFLTAYKHSMREMAILSKMKSTQPTSLPAARQTARI